MNHEQIEAIAAVLRESPTLTEVEIRNGAGVSLRLRRPAPKTARRPAAAVGAATPVSAAAPMTDSAASQADAPSAAESKTVPATASVVGIFRALVGDAAISVGKIVSEGQVIGHIEAMRLLNDCLAPEAGTIASIFVEEGQPVEYGQLLFEIAPQP